MDMDQAALVQNLLMSLQVRKDILNNGVAMLIYQGNSWLYYRIS